MDTTPACFSDFDDLVAHHTDAVTRDRGRAGRRAYHPQITKETHRALDRYETRVALARVVGPSAGVVGMAAAATAYLRAPAETATAAVLTETGTVGAAGALIGMCLPALVAVFTGWYPTDKAVTRKKAEVYGDLDGPEELLLPHPAHAAYVAFGDAAEALHGLDASVEVLAQVADTRARVGRYAVDLHRLRQVGEESTAAARRLSEAVVQAAAETRALVTLTRERNQLAARVRAELTPVEQVSLRSAADAIAAENAAARAALARTEQPL